MLRQTIAIVILSIAIVPPLCFGANDAVSMLERGVAEYEKGNIGESIANFKQASALFEASQRKTDHVETLVALAGVYQSAGMVILAEKAYKEALKLNEGLENKRLLSETLNGLGSLWILSGTKYREKEEDPEVYLSLALGLAREVEDNELEASVCNNLGNLLTGKYFFEDAEVFFREGIEAAKEAGRQDLAAINYSNLAANCVLRKEDQKTIEYNQEAEKLLDLVKDNFSKSQVLVKIGNTYKEIVNRAPDKAQASQRIALAGAAYKKAIDIFMAQKNGRGLTYALGYMAELYEMDGRLEEARELAGDAIKVAGSADNTSDALYRWQWMIGRLDWNEKKVEEAIQGYEEAILTIQGVKQDLATVYGSIHSHQSFREKVGRIYYEYANLLFEHLKTKEGEQRQVLLVKIRDAIESLKERELSDYFQDDCSSMIESKINEVSDIDDKAAVIYLVPLPDKIEILVDVAKEIHHFTTPVSSEEFMKEAKLLRHHLEWRSNYYYMPHGKRMYRWIISPIESLLEEKGVETLIFVPDGALRTVPLAALCVDDKQYLVDKYSVTVAPGLRLMESKPVEREQIKILFAGLSEARHGYSPLPAVDREEKLIKSICDVDVLANNTFTQKGLESQFESGAYQVVHIASHGQFRRNLEDTFLLTYDDNFTLNELENMIRPSMFRDNPVELLTMSACQTAAGDDRAALGLAGVAIKAGARSALATLWYVSDEATAELIKDFYNNYVNLKMPKGKALQQAQITLKSDVRFKHPRYWAPYIIVGNWQ